MMASPTDYSTWLATLTDAEREALAGAGITGPPEDAPILSAGRYSPREGDGLAHFLKNGSALPCSAADDFCDEAPDELRADLGEALRAVFVWILRGAEAHQLFKKPQRFAIRFGLVCRFLGLNRFENLSLSDMARLGGVSRAAVSKSQSRSEMRWAIRTLPPPEIENTLGGFAKVPLIGLGRSEKNLRI